ncbi:Na+/H+ antiporter subunit A [Microcella daejeonensis]|uniref:Na+/H+ antiporter subunit A n=1 Tax=Microcella daejeonensis TaxID=2994971 RepID=UPI002270D2A7|nr:Na+/H+ antiporter subunit A [Microcella daejeonensis]WAB83975.1 Na+/H+ antiporter subunit A [Microcella daejeonensis]
MLLVLLVFGAAAAGLVFLTPYVKRGVFLLGALVPLAGFVHALVVGPAVLGGSELVERLPWIPELGLTLDLRMDPLSWVLTLVVTGVGALVMLYCTRYFGRDSEGIGRFASTLTAFAGAMYGLILAEDVFLLFVFWELTSVLSYLLIGHYQGRKASRGAALQALITTTLGGLVMLVGLVLLSVEAGSSSLRVIVASAPSGALTTAAIVLILVGAISKSAIVPFHFWLPGAMAAPTPVSAYLHAAAMVKAGIYLVARLAPGFALTPSWRELLVGLGIATMLLGGWAALKQTDIKLLLAYGTVSQLGFLMIVTGWGTRDAALAATALLVAHALFKAALFLVVGIVDHGTGTRDLRKLSGLGRRAPVLAGITVLALASMAGLPPLFGFVAKEAVLHGLIVDAEAGDGLALAAVIGVVLGSVLTAAYSIRFFWGAFCRKPGVAEVEQAAEVVPTFLVAPAILAVASLALGPLAAIADRAIAPVAAAYPDQGTGYHLELWHGLTLELGLSVLALVLGAALFVAREPLARLQARVHSPVSASELYWDAVGAVDRLAVRVTGVTQRGSLPFYLGVILVVFVVVTTSALLLGDTWPDELRLWDHPAQAAIGLVMIIAAIAATRAQKRFTAVVVVGVTGFGMSAIFALMGAPDLAITQILVELVTLIAFVLVLRRLPAALGDKHGSTRKLVRALLGIAVGVVMGVIAIVASGARVALPISLEWPELAYVDGHGRNIVNVALVDIRAWDTMGELAVVIAAATGVASLLFIRGRADSGPRARRGAMRRRVEDRLVRVKEQAAPGELRNAWILAGPTLDPRNRSILLEVVVRLLFHALIVVSLYLLFAGHNLPGGGFAGGLVAGLALVARYLAGGRYELGAAAPIGAGTLLGTGLLLAVGTAVVPLLLGADALTSTYFEGEVWLLGEVEFVTSTIFDVGVYLVVVGLVLDVLRSLGAEVDRQGDPEFRVPEPVRDGSADEPPMPGEAPVEGVGIDSRGGPA